MISFCNLIGGALAEPPEVNGLNPPMLPGSFLPCTDRGNELGDKAGGGGGYTLVPGCQVVRLSGRGATHWCQVVREGLWVTAITKVLTTALGLLNSEVTMIIYFTCSETQKGCCVLLQGEARQHTSLTTSAQTKYHIWQLLWQAQ